MKEENMDELNFNSQICTSREQSERLLALGLKKKTADCHYEGRKNKECEWEVAVMGGCYYSGDFPAWSLHRLMSLVFNSSATHVELFEDDDAYEILIYKIEMRIKEGYFNKEYLEE